MKMFFPFIALLLFSLHGFSQSQITEKGYFYSPIGFTCYDNNIYTADMKTLVRLGFPERDSDGYKLYNWGYKEFKIEIPQGSEIIPSNLLYHPTPHHLIRSTEDVSYDVYIPSSVKYIALDAFVFPFVRFHNYDKDPSAIIERNSTKSIEVKEVARYNLNGQKVNVPVPGVNIVQMSDRTSKKELVK